MTTQDLYAVGLRLWADWTRMWNEKPELALDLVAERFALHLVTPSAIDATKVLTPSDVKAWVTQHRSRFTRLVFHVDGCGPFVDVTAGVVAGPWWAEASTSEKPAVVCGMDTLAFRDGKIREYWTIAKEADEVDRWPEQLLR